MTPDANIGAVVFLAGTAAVCLAVALEGLTRRGGLDGMRVALTVVSSSAAVAAICLLGASQEALAAQAIRWHVAQRVALGGLGAGALGAAASIVRWRPTRAFWMALGSGVAFALVGVAVASRMSPSDLVRTPISWFPTHPAVRAFDAGVIVTASVAVLAAAVWRLRTGGRYGRREMKVVVVMQACVAVAYFGVRLWAPPFAMQVFGVSLTAVSALVFWVLLRNWRVVGVGAEAYRLLFRAQSLPAIAIDLHTEAAVLNPAAALILGPRMNAAQVLRKLGLPGTVDAALRAHGGRRLTHLTVEGAEDRAFEVLVHHDPDQDIGLLVLMDVTERALHARDLSRTLTELRQMQERLVTNEKMAALGVLVAGVNHEINNPLAYTAANVRTSLELAEALLAGVPLARAADGTSAQSAALRAWARRPLVQEAEEDLLAALREAQDGCARIQETIASMRLLSRQSEADEPIELAEVIHAGVRIGRTSVSPGIELHVDVNAPLPVRAAAGELSRLVTNLLVNAGQALGERGRIAVHAFREGDEAVLEVKDDGPGVPAQLRPRIFEPFFTTRAPGVGTGLGLAIGYETARRHGGHLRLLDTDGPGACFQLRLPLVRE